MLPFISNGKTNDTKGIRKKERDKEMIYEHFRVILCSVKLASFAINN
jgi:hypothetical protein